MKSYKTIISDIDGTLTPIKPNALPSQKVTDAIKQAIDKGIIVSLASGRPFFLVKYLIKHLGQLGPSIVDNGACIVDSQTEKILWQATISPDQANQILRIIGNQGFIRSSTTEGGVDNPKSIPKSVQVYKLSVHDIKLSLAAKLIDKISNEFPNITTVKAASYQADYLTDIYLSDIHATKQQAIVKLAELIQIPTKEIIGIGDGYNDFTLLTACGHKVAMGNAVDELISIADEIAPSVDNDGLAFIIHKYFINYPLAT